MIGTSTRMRFVRWFATDGSGIPGQPQGDVGRRPLERRPRGDATGLRHKRHWSLVPRGSKMSKQLSERQYDLLRLVAVAGGDGARLIDLEMSARHGPSETTVRAELLDLAAAGFIEVDEDRGVGGTCAPTKRSRHLLEVRRSDYCR